MVKRVDQTLTLGEAYLVWMHEADREQLSSCAFEVYGSQMNCSWPLNDTVGRIDLDPEMTVNEARVFGSQRLEFRVVKDLKPTVTRALMQKDAFALLMSKPDVNFLPKQMNTDHYGPFAVRNCIIDYLRKNKSFFSTTETDEAEKFVSGLSKVMWYLNGQEQKFVNAGPGVPALPGRLVFDLKRKLGHKTLPKLNVAELETHHNALAGLLLMPGRIQKDSFEVVMKEFSEVHVSMVQYAEYLKCQLNKVNERNNLLNTGRPLINNVDCSTIAATVTPTAAIYIPLMNRLKRSAYYTVVDVAEFAPALRSSRHTYIKQLGFKEFAIHVIRRLFGGKKVSFTGVMRVDSGDDAGVQQTRILRSTTDAFNRLPQYYSREQRKLFLDAVGVKPKKTRGAILALYQLVTGDLNTGDAIEDKDYLDDLTAGVEGGGSEVCYSAIYQFFK